MTLNLKKKVTLTASQMLAENNRATADRLTWAAQTDEANLRTALNVPENGLTEEMAEEARDRYGRNVSRNSPLYSYKRVQKRRPENRQCQSANGECPRSMAQSNVLLRLL